MGNSRVTVREIARLAGVSVATVSRVSNGIGQVSEETRRRVLNAIEAHGYRPDHLGRALAAGRHGAVGLVFPGLAGPYFAELIQGFELEAMQSAAVHILCTHLREDSDAQVIEMARRVDGITVLGGTVSDQAVRRLAKLVPVVMLAGLGPDSSVPSVRAENMASMAELTRHLLVHHGLRDLAFVGNPAGSPDVSERWDGFRAAHRELAMTPPPAPVEVGLQQSDGVLAADQLLGRDTPPRGIVCANDETALGVLVGALGRGLRVPQDVVITGFDDVSMSALVSPPLTTVRQPIRELAAEAARQLLRAAVDPDGEPPESVLLPTELVVRGSCGCLATPGA